MNYNVNRYRVRGNYKTNQLILQRNESIREDFRRMKLDGIKNRDAFFFLAQKYFLSEGTINSIIYARKALQKNTELKGS